MNNIDLNGICLKLLTLKMVFLLALLSEQRLKTFKSFSIDSLDITENTAKCQKQFCWKSRPGYHLSSVSFSCYEVDRNLCVVTHLRQYIKETANLRNPEQLLKSCLKPDVTLLHDG